MITRLIGLLTFLFLGNVDVSSQNNNTIDIVMCINGSGSISSDDFQLQLEGIGRSILDASIFPRDGSRSFGLVQYANGTTSTHVPLTRIDNESDINSILAGISSAIQIEGLTNPGDGIEIASSILENSTASKQVICLSSDGLPNSGIDVASASTIAKNKGIDQLGVIGFDLSSGDVGSFQNIYQNAISIIGQGSVTIAKNVVDFANIVGASCVSDIANLIAIEVNQGIQNWDNKVKPIQGKETIVRVFFESSKQNIPVEAKLHAFRNGSELSGSPRSSENLLSSVPEDATSNSVREDLDKTLNFSIPEDWMTGEIELEVRGVSPISCLDQTGVANDCKTNVSFRVSPNLSINLQKVIWNDQNGNKQESTDEDLTNWQRRLESIYPIGRKNLFVSSGFVVDRTTDTNFLPLTGDTWDNVNLDLKTQRIIANCGILASCQNIFYANITANLAGVIGSACGIPGTESSGLMPQSIDAYATYNHAHELAHSLGIEHVLGCNAPSDNPDPNYTYFFPDAQGNTIAAIGNLEGSDQEIMWGFDAQNDRVIDPNVNYELMSYCNNGFTWPSDITYENIYNALGNVTSFAPKGQLKMSSTDHLLISGTINKSSGKTEIRPIISIANSSEQNTSSGPHQCNIFDDSNNLIRSFSFDESVSSENLQNATFLVVIQKPSNLGRIELQFQGLGTKTILKSNHTPNIEVIHPNGGEVITNDNFEVSWNSSDMDGDEIFHTILYSSDNGGTWNSLVNNITAKTYSINSINIQGSQNALIRVIASDGLNSSEDQSNSPFSTKNNPPYISITKPDKAIYYGVQPVSFQVLTRDNEDIVLPLSNIIWESSIDGQIGTGEFEMLASDLSEGVHLLNVTGTDSGGLKSTSQLEIEILRLRPPSISPISPESQAIPTLSQWGLIILALILLIISTLAALKIFINEKV